MTNKQCTEDNQKKDDLIELAKELQVRGFQTKAGIYLAVDRGFDTLLRMEDHERAVSLGSYGRSFSLECYIETCEKSLATQFGMPIIKGILLKLVQLGKLGNEWDASMQVNYDLIAGPFKTENETMEIAPYVLSERYGWNPKNIERINFYSLCF